MPSTINILSLGLGVQSTWLYYLSALHLLPPFDAVIFVDPGKESVQTYAYLNYLIGWSSDYNATPITVIKKKNLFTDLLNYSNSSGQRFSSIPAYTKNEDGSIGMLRRQCTKEYKIEQVDKAIREHLSVSRIDKIVHVWKGISLDEIDRMSIPQQQWKVHVYPFCGYSVTKIGGAIRLDSTRMNRVDIISAYNKYNLPIPPKSSCVFCPYRSDHSWHEMKLHHQEDWAAAVQIDRTIRYRDDLSNPIYLHRSCVPLEEIVFKDQLPDLWHGECSGECGI